LPALLARVRDVAGGGPRWHALLPEHGLHEQGLGPLAGALRAEYAGRQALLLKRLDVTVLSFVLAGNKGPPPPALDAAYRAYRAAAPRLAPPSAVALADLALASRGAGRGPRGAGRL
jgi:hypothetical protein